MRKLTGHLWHEAISRVQPCDCGAVFDCPIKAFVGDLSSHYQLLNKTRHSNFTFNYEKQIDRWIDRYLSKLSLNKYSTLKIRSQTLYPLHVKRLRKKIAMQQIIMFPPASRPVKSVLQLLQLMDKPSQLVPLLLSLSATFKDPLMIGIIKDLWCEWHQGSQELILVFSFSFFLLPITCERVFVRVKTAWDWRMDLKS